MELLKRCKEILSKCWNRLTLSIAELIFGICILISSSGFANVLFVLFGVVLALSGVLYGIQFFTESVEDARKKHHLVTGLFFLLIGVFSVFKSGWLVGIFPLLTAFYGSITLLAGILKIEMTFLQVRMGEPRWYMTFASLLLTAIIALFLFINPFQGNGIWILTGILLILAAVTDFLCHLVLIGKIKVPEKIGFRFPKKENNKPSDMKNDIQETVAEAGETSIQEEESQFTAPDVEADLQQNQADTAYVADVPELVMNPDEEENK